MSWRFGISVSKHAMPAASIHSSASRRAVVLASVRHRRIAEGTPRRSHRSFTPTAWSRSMRLGLDGMTTRSALFTDSSSARPYGAESISTQSTGSSRRSLIPRRCVMSAGAADITSNGNGSPSSSALYHQSFASPCTSASTTSTCCSPRDWSTRAQARNTALVVFMLPPLPVANAMTIGSRFFLSFIGFSLFWFYGFSVFTGSGIAVSSRLKALPCAST